MKDFDFKGVITALVTPFKKGDVDWKSFENLVDQQISKGIQGLVVNGTTAESPTLSCEEVKRLFEITKERVGTRFPVILGTGSNNTISTIENTQKAQELGADMALVVVPYYNKPPQRGMIEHFKMVAENVDLPIMLYNVPGRTVVSMLPDTVIQLSEVKNIVGVKEAGGAPFLADTLRTGCGEDFVLLSGDDKSCIDFILNGGDGVISVISNLIPDKMVEVCNIARRKDLLAREVYKSLDDLNDCLCLEPNPMPVKKALELMGIIETCEMRRPMVEMDEKYIPQLSQSLKDLALV